MLKLKAKHPNLIVAGFGVHPCFVNEQSQIDEQLMV